MRRWWWRLVFRLAGGFRVEGPLPSGGCVVVANHSSHADAPALVAALPSAARPAVAAAADHWFRSGLRARACRWAVGGFPVRRHGGGSADLSSVVPLLQAGRAVVIFPEGTRSRSGEMADFRSGAFRLAAEAGVPVVPVALIGTRELLPVSGRGRRGRVVVRLGEPLWRPTPEEAQAAVARMRGEPVKKCAKRSAELPR